jgi:hypothetical protein
MYNKKESLNMELFTNPWFLAFIVFSILVMIYRVAKYHYKSQNKRSYLEKLRDAGIFPTIRVPPNQNDLKGGDSKNKNP